MGIVPAPLDLDFSERKVIQNIHAGAPKGGQHLVAVETKGKRALHVIWKVNWSSLKLLVKLVDEIHLPFESLNLPSTEREGDKGHDTEQDHHRRQPGRLLSSVALFRHSSIPLGGIAVEE